MSAEQHSVSAGNVLSMAAVATVALIPEETLAYVMKVASVLFLAMVAELGRRFISWLWKRFGGSST